MFMSAKVFFKDASSNNAKLLIRGESAIPREWLKRYKKNVVSLTPMKSGALRRSIITLASGNQANVSWRSRYAVVQNSPESYGLTYRNYTTPGTGSHFANKAYARTNAEMPAVLRELGLTK